MRKLRLFLTLPLLFWTLACSITSVIPLTPTPTAYVFPTNTVVTVPPLTVEQLKNADYTIIGFDNGSTLFHFTDGKFTRGEPGSVDYIDLRLLDFFPMGDLNEDGVEDAAVLIAENYGGSGVFVTLAAVLNENGGLHHVGSYLVDDRPQINALEIRNGEIFLNAVVHGPSDAMCCPTFPVTRTFQLMGTSLVLVNATSQTPSGLSRVITIESPLDGQDVSGALIIRGSVTIAPFENNLALRVYNENGNELYGGPVMVNAPDLGAPGTFNITLDLGILPPGRFLIEISDLSAADGSILALDSVMVIVR